jgi:hypothetical protein
VRADLRQAPLRGLGEPVEDRSRDRQLENAVAEELEPLVRLGAFLCPRSVGEDLGPPSSGEPVDQAAELIGPGLVSLSPGAR